jgi:hypothetical protein
LSAERSGKHEVAQALRTLCEQREMARGDFR